MHVPRAPELDAVVGCVRLAAAAAARAVGSRGAPLPAAGPDAVSRALHHRLPPPELPVARGGRGVAPPAAGCPVAAAQRPARAALLRLLPAAVFHTAEPRGPPLLHVSPRQCSGLGPIEGQPHPLLVSVEPWPRA